MASGRLENGDKPPARVVALEAQVNDTAIAWNEDTALGTITIVFSNKGKMMFDKPLPQPKKPSPPLGEREEIKPKKEK